MVGWAPRETWPSPTDIAKCLLERGRGSRADVPRMPIAAPVWFEIQDTLDVLSAGLSRRTILLPNMGWTGGIPPLDSTREPYIDRLGLRVVCFGHNTLRSTDGNPLNHCPAS